MAKKSNRFYVTITYGITAFTFLILVSSLYWNTKFGDLLISELLSLSIIAFVVGAVFAVIIYFYTRRGDINLTAISLVALLGSLYIFPGDCAIGTLAWGYIAYAVIIALVSAFVAGLIVFGLNRG